MLGTIVEVRFRTKRTKSHLGLACAEALAGEGVRVILNGRDATKLEKSAAGLHDRTRGEVQAVAADISTARSAFSPRRPMPTS